MGEYAIRTSDGEEIKIGVCQTMYYLRYDDRYAVLAFNDGLSPSQAHEHGLYFRLPLVEEDGIAPGDYATMDGTIPLIHNTTNGTFPFHDPAPLSAPGEGAELVYLHATRSQDVDVVLPVVRCCHCDKQRITTWEAIWAYLPPVYEERFAAYRPLSTSSTPAQGEASE